MANTIVFSYFLTAPKIWYKLLEANQFGRIKETCFEFSENLGLGQLEYLILQPGFWVQQMSLKLKHNMDLTQMAGQTNSMFVINFYLSNAQIKLQTDEKLYEFAYDNVSVLLNSATSVSHYYVPKNEDVNIFQIGFTKAWLMANAFGEEESPLKSLFESDDPLCFSESLDYRFKYIIESVDIKTSGRLALLSAVFQLLNAFISSLNNRNDKLVAVSNIHHTDLDQLMHVKTEMDLHPFQEIKLEGLAEQSKMSLSKFKRLFKQVFGMTPYKYHLKNKLSVAHELLQNGAYSVSEIGFLAGYSNLSQFSKAFKNQYGKLPSEITN